MLMSAYGASLVKRSVVKLVGHKYMNRRISLAVARQRRVRRVRSALGAGRRPRLSVHATGRHIYTQLIDDSAGTTIVSANSCEPVLSSMFASGGNVDAASIVGRILAERAIEAGISHILFDRGGRRFHGRIAAVADSARKSGLLF